MAARLTGELKTWHKTTLDFTADATFGESASTFRDHRLDVTFTHQKTGQKITVPGFFAADGDAADTGATSGKVWRVNFNAPLEGNWTYEASFRTAADIAASTDPQAGKAVAYINGESGSFSIAETDKTGEDFRAKGMIVQDQGTHYLQHQGDGDYFVRGGPGVPENFLATTAFDNTPTGRHDYSTHKGDYNSGDPTWDGGKGKNLIGAVNYLAENGQNTVYLLTLTAAGDGKDVWPWAATDLHKLATDTANLDPSITSVYDVSKLAQWEMVFDHMDAKGIYKNVLLQERENDQLLDGGTDDPSSSLSVERLIYMREMVARFGHNNGIQWNLGEENTNTTTERKDMASWLKAVDPYDHLVTIHNWPTELKITFDPLLGHDTFDGTSFQIGSDAIRGLIANYRDKSAANGDPWVLTWDENATKESVIEPYSNNPDSANESALRETFWGTLTAGGSGGNWYIRNSSGQSFDQNMDDFKAFSSLWTWTAAATDFYNTHIPFWEMSQHDAATPNGRDYVMSGPGEVYTIYLPYGEADNVRLDLSDYANQTFEVFWYNPRTGGSLIADGQIEGGAIQTIGDAPANVGKDWVVLVRNTDAEPIDGVDTGDNAGVEPEPDPVLPSDSGDLIARDDSATVAAGGEERIHVLANDEDPDGTAVYIGSFTQAGYGSVERGGGGRLTYIPDAGFTGTDSFTYTAIDQDGDTATATVTVTVKGDGASTDSGGQTDPDPTPPPTTDSGDGYYLEENGLVKVQVEDVVGGASGWVYQDGKNGNNPGFEGDGYYYWKNEGTTGFLSKADQGQFTTTIYIQKAGTYNLFVRGARDSNNPSDARNDVWVKVDNDTVSLMPSPPPMVESNGFVKIYGLHGVDPGNWATLKRFDDKNTHNDPLAKVQLDEGFHTITFSGRSDGFHIDSFQLTTERRPNDFVVRSKFVTDGNDPDPNPNPGTPSTNYDIDAGGAGDSGFSGGKTYEITTAVAGTTEDALYQTERYGDFNYALAAENGAYDVTLKFAEIYFDAAGKRLFDVKAEGATVLDDFDIWTAAGGTNIAHDVVIPVEVKDGQLDLEFISVIQNAKISGIEIAPAAEAPGSEGSTNGLIARNDSATLAEGGSERIHVLANDEDPDGTAIWIESFAQAQNGIVERGGGGRLTYTPNEGFSGTDSFSYTAIDQDGDLASAIVSMTVVDSFDLA